MIPSQAPKSGTALPSFVVTPVYLSKRKGGMPRRGRRPVTGFRARLRCNIRCRKADLFVRVLPPHAALEHRDFLLSGQSAKHHDFSVSRGARIWASTQAIALMLTTRRTF